MTADLHDLDAPIDESLMNPVLACIEERSTTRAFSDRPVTPEERHAILHAASRAPSAGAMMFYSMISIDDPDLRRRVCDVCDAQHFMYKAPFWLLFVVDNRKWLDLYQHVDCYGNPELAQFAEHSRRKPGLGDLLLSCEDAMCAAQTAVIAAESMGIGSCYIGDVIEHGEELESALGLPPATVPLALVVFGHKNPRTKTGISVSCTVDDQPSSSGIPREAPLNTPHPVVNLYMAEAYRRADEVTLDAQVAELDNKFTPHAVANGALAGERVRKLYHRKHTSDFMAEMNRSAAWWVERWCANDVEDGTVEP